VQQQQEEIEREHNREISELKSNLRNSVFEEEAVPRTEQVWSFAVTNIAKLQQYSEENLTQSMSQVQL
jgi:hypothetical protein